MHHPQAYSPVTKAWMLDITNITHQLESKRHRFANRMHQSQMKCNNFQVGCTVFVVMMHYFVKTKHHCVSVIRQFLNNVNICRTRCNRYDHEEQIGTCCIS